MMAVPRVVAASRSPARKPAGIETVADARPGLSASAMGRAGDSVVAGPPAVNPAEAATLPSTGASFTAVIASVVAAIAVFAPSNTAQETVRVVLTPPLVGSSLSERNR